MHVRQCNVADIAKNVTSFDWGLGVRTAPEKPRHILIALQQDKSDSQVKNASVFDNLEVTQMSVILNNTKYPSRDVSAVLEHNSLSSITECLVVSLKTIMELIEY